MINISVIIPHYNSPKTLSTLLDSIPNKKQIEVLVIDDNSSSEFENELSYVKDKKKENVSFYENTTKLPGAGVCRNIGLDKSNGKWILFADDDDYFLDECWDKVEEYNDTGYEVVFFKPTSIESDTGDISDRHVPYEKILSNYQSKRDNKSTLDLRYSFVVPWSKLYKRSFLRKHNIYFDEVLVSNDIMFSTQVGYYMENFKIDNGTIYCVTKSKGSLTTTLSRKIILTRLEVFVKYFNYLKGILDDSEFTSLKLSGRGFVLMAKSLGIKEILPVYLTLKKNKIPIFNKEIFKFSWLVSRIKIIKSRRRNSKYNKTM
ncbi:glycosyltransferase family 2 protein [Halobacillus faecis]|uniref:Glycosyltransferase 2-like domain-containing protein n=1 Tax=Halobacillus faecis TaxID=360184 RepID=A0A511WWG4_9BACI|nr:glycosyltransferase family 2 protein [Halobacillus faecis]GEN54618.1 hypothetical protein HFA01_28800 [Halobacillus faecis]